MVLIYFLLATPLVFYSYFLSRYKGIPYYSNFFFIFILFFQGLIIKTLCVYYELPSNEIVMYLISPVLLIDYWKGSILTLPFYLLFIIAMLFFSPKKNFKHFNKDINSNNICFDVIILWIMSIISLIGFAVFIYNFPILLTTLSKSSLAAYSLQDYSSGTLWRLIISFGYIVSILSLWNIGKKYKRKHSIFLFVSNAIVYIIFNVISDQRSYILVGCFLWLLLYHLFIMKLSFRKVFSIISFFIIIVIAQTINRVSESKQINFETITSSITNFIGRNGIEHSKTIHIVSSVPSKLDYLLGETFIDSISILVPRALFKDKSTVNIETIVAKNFFDSDLYGAGAIPPGVIAEMFMNFGLLGIILGISFAGAITGFIELKFNNTKIGSLYFFFYFTSLYTFGASVIGSSLSNTLTSLIINFIPLCICYFSSKIIFNKNLNHNLH